MEKALKLTLSTPSVLGASGTMPGVPSPTTNPCEARLTPTPPEGLTDWRGQPWTPASGHYRLQVLGRPATGVPGRVSVAIVLPQPQLPQSVHDVTVDNTLSHPIDTQHSWTYPGFGCGGLIRPQFAESVLYAQAQGIAFQQVRNSPQITGPLISTAESQARQVIRDNFIQPTVNGLGYTLVDVTIRWSAAA